MASKAHMICVKPQKWRFSHSGKWQVTGWAWALGEQLCKKGQANWNTLGSGQKLIPMTRKEESSP